MLAFWLLLWFLRKVERLTEQFCFDLDQSTDMKFITRPLQTYPIVIPKPYANRHRSLWKVGRTTHGSIMEFPSTAKSCTRWRKMKQPFSVIFSQRISCRGIQCPLYEGTLNYTQAGGIVYTINHPLEPKLLILDNPWAKILTLLRDWRYDSEYWSPVAKRRRFYPFRRLCPSIYTLFVIARTRGPLKVSFICNWLVLLSSQLEYVYLWSSRNQLQCILP